MGNGNGRQQYSSYIGSIGTILIVDDEPAYSFALVEILRNDGFEVHWAVSADEARTLMKDVSPDLLLVDVVMPVESGLTLIRKLRSQSAWAQLPIIVISARTMPDDRAAALEAGADAFLAKPFSRQDLRAVIRPFAPTAIPIPSLPSSVPSPA